MTSINLDAASPHDVERAALDYAETEGGWESWGWWRDESGEDQEVPGLGTVTTVQSEGGGEGSGENTHLVIRVVQDGVIRYFKKTGYYSSYDGTDWDGEICSVWPTQKTVTVYE